jgi:hypothetical protein
MEAIILKIATKPKLHVVTIKLIKKTPFTQLQKSRRNSKILSYAKQFLSTTFRFILTQPRSSNPGLLIPYKGSDSVKLESLKGEVVP